MTLSLVLPWFPIVLAVGVGGRLLNRSQGMGFGILGACFWALLVQAAAGPAIFAQWELVLAWVAGAGTIVAMGVWASSAPAWAGVLAAANSGPAAGPASSASRAYGSVGDALDRFENALETYCESMDPWPDFSELLRVVLHDLCGATHVYPYHVMDEPQRLLPLRAVDAGASPSDLLTGNGIVEHVITTGRSFVAGDKRQSVIVPDTAQSSSEPLAWCFTIREGSRTIGLIKVGHLVGSAKLDHRLLATAEGLVRRFWITLDAVCRRRVAETCDPASGLRARTPFLCQGEKLLAATYGRNEPAVVVVISLEGLRAMCDHGHWALADELVKAVADLLTARVRGDDLIGRFDGSRFVLLLRRADSALGTLIAEQLCRSLKALCDNPRRWSGPITVRCGLSGSGTDSPDLVELVCRAVQRCNQARKTNATLCSGSPANIDDAAEPVALGAKS